MQAKFGKNLISEEGLVLDNRLYTRRVHLE